MAMAPQPEVAEHLAKLGGETLPAGGIVGCITGHRQKGCPMSLEEVGTGQSPIGAFGGVPFGGNTRIDEQRVLSHSSPRVRQFLSAMTDASRRELLDGVRRRLAKEGSLVLLKRNNEQPLIAHLAVGSEGAPAHRPMRLTDLHDFPVPHEDTLRVVFDLTPAEARLAQGVARGDTLEEIASALGIKMTTARTQLASVFAKTGTRRQAKLVAILTRLALLVG
jgi:DNA-binding CsgD family transcriptional regulator